MVNGPGKGDRRRPSSVSEETYSKNWDAIDWKKKTKPAKKKDIDNLLDEIERVLSRCSNA